MREQEGARENVAGLAQAIDGVVRILEGRTVAKQWIRRSVFEKGIAGLQRRGQRVKAQNATLCWWLRPELRALGASIRKLKKAATEAHRRAANERHVERRLRNADADPVLQGLHPAQRRAVVVAEDTQLVLAGAGTGKTQTMAAKVADTLWRGRTTPEHVAVVTFTNKAANEIRERVAKLAGQSTNGMFVGTIHRLAKRVLTQAPGAGGTRIDAIAEPGSRRYQTLERMLDDVLRANASLHEALAVRARAYVRIPPSDGKHGEKVRVSLRTGAIDVRSHGEAAICRVLDARGIEFEYEFEYEAACVEAPASAEERKRQPEAAKVKAECLESGYRPDFKITLDEGTVVWLEHWGVDGQGDPPKGWDEEDRRRYVEGMRWKRRAHEVLGTRLAETSWGQYAEALRGERDWDSIVVEAIARAAGQDPASIDKQFPRKDDGWRPEAETIRILVQEVSEWIGAAGRCGLEEADVERRIEGMEGVSARDEAQALATLAKAVRARYEAHLEDAGTTDFEKMVLDAARALEAGKVRPGFDMMIVDEWQDVNGAQERFVRALSRHGGKAGGRPTLCVVGDDWQSIYGFQGGDPEYTRSFAEKGDACERTDLDRTWRFGKRRAHATRKWALGDAGAVDKQAEGDEKKDGAGAVIEIVGRTVTEAGAERFGRAAGQESAETAIRGILEKIGEKEHGRGKGAGVLLLARRRNTVADSNRPESEEARSVLEEWRTQPWRIPSGVDEHDAEEVRAAAWERARQRKAEGLDHRALRAAARRAGVALDLETMTVHGAKGLEADYVIFVQGKDRKVRDELREKARERALEPLLPAGANGPEEERRVWYVALTRARSGTYVVEPPGDAGDTALLDELWRDEKREYGVGEAELADWLAPYRGDTSCPGCAAAGQAGRLVARTGKKGTEGFVGCTSFRYTDVAGAAPCGHTERRCPMCGKGIVRRTDGASGRCTERECGAAVPLCKCEIPKPMAIRRNRATGEAFWGCQDYRGPENPACGWTRQTGRGTHGDRGARASPGPVGRPAGGRKPTRVRCGRT